MLKHQSFDYRDQISLLECLRLELYGYQHAVT
jgi:hypothetical protein